MQAFQWGFSFSTGRGARVVNALEVEACGCGRGGEGKTKEKERAPTADCVLSSQIHRNWAVMVWACVMTIGRRHAGGKRGTGDGGCLCLGLAWQSLSCCTTLALAGRGERERAVCCYNVVTLVVIQALVIQALEREELIEVRRAPKGWLRSRFAGGRAVGARRCGSRLCGKGGGRLAPEQLGPGCRFFLCWARIGLVWRTRLLQEPEDEYRLGMSPTM